MAKIVWTDPALSDLNEVAEYIALENEAAAKALVQRVFSIVERLANFPESGRIPPELNHLSYREVVVPPCRVFYKYETDQVLILFLMRQERDLRNFLISQ
ncbi:Toxin RelE2 [Marinomonas aquimarina]|uniref:Toxin RelE2 n=1 Tax=Marinomonas aquimarina TaxID=295068 RepID=A0A1A8TEX8_9GAMM|nr:type II toxin-antitoxin system RelE/ParE family toxin [Marinomonas aquimarina]SBS30406.1 Toxin RelE2 [Marinomonas aquimarina]